MSNIGKDGKGNERIILVTGATGGGLGQAIVSQLTTDGSTNIVYAGVRDVEKGKRLFAGVSQKNLIFLPLFLEKPRDTREIVRLIEATHGAVDVLINCAGMGRNWPLECETEETMMETMNVNCLGPIRLCKEVLPGMKKKGSGHIINVTSIGGLIPDEMTEMYNAAKYGLTGFSESLALTARHFGIKVSIVCPGPMDTPSLWNSLVRDYPRDVCDEKTKNLVEEKISQIDQLKHIVDKIVKPSKAAELVVANVVDNKNARLFYVMNFGFLQDRLEAKYKNLV